MRYPVKHGVEWTAEEELLVKATYAFIPPELLAKRLPRHTVEAIRAKAARLGQRRPTQRTRGGAERYTQVGDVWATRQPWNGLPLRYVVTGLDGDRVILRDLDNGKTRVEVAQNINRSKSWKKEAPDAQDHPEAAAHGG